jgi:hypothetical protein
MYHIIWLKNCWWCRFELLFTLSSHLFRKATVQSLANTCCRSLTPCRLLCSPSHPASETTTASTRAVAPFSLMSMLLKETVEVWDDPSNPSVRSTTSPNFSTATLSPLTVHQHYKKSNNKDLLLTWSCADGAYPCRVVSK